MEKGRDEYDGAGVLVWKHTDAHKCEVTIGLREYEALLAENAELQSVVRRLELENAELLKRVDKQGCINGRPW